MDVPIVEVFTVLLRLLPGFASAWVFHGLTGYRKLTWYEQTAEAMIYTAIVWPFVGATETLALFLGRHFFALGTWTDNATGGIGMVYGVALGLLMSRIANENFLHNWLSKMGFTKGTSYASEWYSAFYKSERFVYLTLRDGRRIYGWPEEYPDRPDEGHFVLTCAVWLSETEATPLPMIERILIPAKLIKIVEFEKLPAEWPEQPTTTE